MSIEKGADVEHVHIDKDYTTEPTATTDGTKKASEFANCEVSVDSSVEKPTFSRDSVEEIGDNGTIICTIDIAGDTQIVKINKEGIYEQATVAKPSASEVYVDISNASEETKSAVNQLVNSYDDRNATTGEINDKVFESGENTVTISFDMTTREFVTTVKNTESGAVVTDESVISAAKNEATEQINNEVVDGGKSTTEVSKEYIPFSIYDLATLREFANNDYTSGRLDKSFTIETSEATSTCVTFNSEIAKTLDLYGNTITASYIGATNCCFINNKSILTIKSSKEGGTITYSASPVDADSIPSYGCYTIDNYGTLNLLSGNIINTSDGGYALYGINHNQGYVNISGGVVKSNYSFAIRDYIGSYIATTKGTSSWTEITMTGGTLEGGIWVQNAGSNCDNGKITIAGGTLSGSSTSLNVGYGNATFNNFSVEITGGTFTNLVLISKKLSDITYSNAVFKSGIYKDKATATLYVDNAKYYNVCSVRQELNSDGTFGSEYLFASIKDGWSLSDSKQYVYNSSEDKAVVFSEQGLREALNKKITYIAFERNMSNYEIDLTSNLVIDYDVTFDMQYVWIWTGNYTINVNSGCTLKIVDKYGNTCKVWGYGTVYHGDIEGYGTVFSGEGTVTGVGTAVYNEQYGYYTYPTIVN